MRMARALKHFLARFGLRPNEVKADRRGKQEDVESILLQSADRCTQRANALGRAARQDFARQREEVRELRHRAAVLRYWARERAIREEEYGL